MAQISLGAIGNLDFEDWLLGLAAAFIQGGASAVVGGVAVAMVDPTHFNPATGNFYKVVVAVFLMNATMGMFSFLREKPVPQKKVVTTTTETTETAIKPPVVVTTVQETHIEPLAPKTDK